MKDFKVKIICPNGENRAFISSVFAINIEEEKFLVYDPANGFSWVKMNFTNFKGDMGVVLYNER